MRQHTQRHPHQHRGADTEHRPENDPGRVPGLNPPEQLGHRGQQPNGTHQQSEGGDKANDPTVQPYHRPEEPAHRGGAIHPRAPCADWQQTLSNCECSIWYVVADGPHKPLDSPDNSGNPQTISQGLAHENHRWKEKQQCGCPRQEQQRRLGIS